MKWLDLLRRVIRWCALLFAVLYFMEWLPEVIYAYSAWRETTALHPLSPEHYRKEFFSELSFILIVMALGISLFVALRRKSVAAGGESTATQ